MTLLERAQYAQMETTAEEESQQVLVLPDTTVKIPQQPFQSPTLQTFSVTSTIGALKVPLFLETSCHVESDSSALTKEVKLFKIALNASLGTYAAQALSLALQGNTVRTVMFLTCRTALDGTFQALKSSLWQRCAKSVLMVTNVMTQEFQTMRLIHVLQAITVCQTLIIQSMM